MRALAYIDAIRKRLIARLTPDHAANHDAARGSRLVVRVALLTLCVCTLMQAVYFAEGAVVIATMVWASIGLQLLGLILHRVTGSYRVGGHVHILSLWTLFGGISVLSGGIESPNIVANFFLVVLAPMLLGRRHGLGWLAVVVVTYVVEFQLTARGLAHQTLPPAEIAVTRLTELAVTSVTTGLTAYFFAKGEERMRAEVAEDKQQLELVNADLRVILDSTGQGFLGLDQAGRVTGERSASVDTWFRGVEAGKPFAELLEPLDARVAERFAMEWTQVEAGFLALEASLAQLPKLLELGDTTLRLEYRTALVRDGHVEKYVVVISDISAEVARELAEARQLDLLQAFERILRDADGFGIFLKSARRAVLALTSGELAGAELKRCLHTLKGNSGTMGLSAVARACHELEEALAAGETLAPAAFRTLAREFESADARLRPFVATQASDIALHGGEYEEFLRALSARMPYQELARVARGWRHRRVGRHLERLAEYASQLGERLGKGKLELQVEGGDLRMPDRFAEFWDEIVHVVRNAVDHGMETEAERAASGKAAGVLRLTAASRAGRFVVEISDNGRGIDWAGVRALARKRGLPANSDSELVAALLADGFSTSASVSETSGRGVGMASVRTVCAKLCIGIEAVSSAGAGTTFRFVFPEQPLELPECLAVPA